MVTRTNINDGLDEKTIDPNPVEGFKDWLDEATAPGLPLPEAMTLATATPDGKPSGRMVLLKQVDDNDFVFFTNYQRSKGRILDENPDAALALFLPQLK